MDFNQYTIKSREAVQKAQQIALGNSNQAIEPAHLFKGMMETEQDVLDFIIEKQSGNIQHINNEIADIISGFPKVSGGSGNHISNETNKILISATEEAKKMKDEFISLEHLLLGFLKNNSNVSQILKDQGISYDATIQVINELPKRPTRNL